MAIREFVSMPDELTPSVDILPVPGVIAALCDAKTASERRPIIEQIRRGIENGRVILREQSHWQDQLYEDVVYRRQPLPAVIQRVEGIAEEWQRSADEHRRRKESFLREIDKAPELRDAEFFTLIEEHFGIADEILSLYPALRARLSKLAAARGEGPGTILRARPVDGAIDQAELTREIIRRFPNILAELAK